MNKKEKNKFLENAAASIFETYQNKNLETYAKDTLKKIGEIRDLAIAWNYDGDNKILLDIKAGKI